MLFVILETYAHARAGVSWAVTRALQPWWPRLYTLHTEFEHTRTHVHDGLLRPTPQGPSLRRPTRARVCARTRVGVLLPPRTFRAFHAPRVHARARYGALPTQAATSDASYASNTTRACASASASWGVSVHSETWKPRRPSLPTTRAGTHAPWALRSASIAPAAWDGPSRSRRGRTPERRFRSDP